MTGLAQSSVEGCINTVQKPNHTLCLDHWKTSQRVAEESATYQIKETVATQGEGNGLLSATTLGEQFKIEAKQINRVLVELGWIEKDGKGWAPTKLGEKLKA